MLKVGITGGMGTGKATVAAMFARLGAAVIDADELARRAVMPGKPAWKAVVDAFGGSILAPDGSIDRQALAEVVFRDGEKLGLLNSLIHPPVAREMRRRLARAAEEAGRRVAVANVPLLFEAGLEGDFDRVITVVCPREEQIRRCCARDGLGRDEVERRIRTQMDIEEKERRSDYVIANGGSREDTERQVRDIWMKLTGGPV